MIDELRDMLNYAEKKNVLVTACLWNGAVQKSQALVYFHSQVCDCGLTVKL